MPTSVRRRIHRRPAVRAVATLGLASLLVTGCQSAVKQQESQASASSSASCQRGGTLVTANAVAPLPSQVFQGNSGNITWVREVFEPLVYVDQTKPNQIQPLLATSWTFGDGGKSMTLQLRNGVTFQSGRPFTSADVVFTLHAAAEPTAASNVRSILAGWTVQAKGDHEVTISSQTPFQSIAGQVLNETPIVDQQTFSGIADGSKLIGTGPMKVQSYQPGIGITLVRNDNYWDKKLPYLDGIQDTVIADSTAQLSALQSGRVQFAAGLTTNDAQTAVSSGSQFQLQETSSLQYSLGFDVTQAPFNNQQVRQAIAYAIDRDRINQQVFGGTGNTNGLYWQPGTIGYPKDLANYYKYDPAKAKKMIQEAGAVGAPVKIEIINNPRLQAEYQIIANNLTAVGLKPEVEALAPADYQSRNAKGQLTPAFLSLRAQGGLPAQLVAQTSPDLVTKGQAAGYSNPEYATLQQKLVNANGNDQIASAEHNLTKFLLDQSFVQLLVTAPSLAVKTKSLHGIIGAQQAMMLRSACLTSTK